MKEPITIYGLWLHRAIDNRGRDFDRIEVYVELEDGWHYACREQANGLFSHIVEPSGIARGPLLMGPALQVQPAAFEEATRL